MIDELAKRRIKAILNIAEQGVEQIPYGKVEVINDGPGGKRQVTLSVGFTQYGENLGRVIKEYVKRGGKYGGLENYEMNDPSLANSKAFKGSLKMAGADPIMQAVQEELYEKLYIAPGLAWAEKEGFELALSGLVICDSFLHSGSILAFLRERFDEKTPAHGGREKAWISDYLGVRHKWLAGHSNKLLRNTVYRTKYYRELLTVEDWGLERHHEFAMHGTKPTQIVRGFVEG
jgi:chitosanase